MVRVGYVSSVDDAGICTFLLSKKINIVGAGSGEDELRFLSGGDVTPLCEDDGDETQADPTRLQ